MAQFQFIEVQERTTRKGFLWTVEAENLEQAHELAERREGACSEGWDVGDEIVYGESAFALVVNGDKEAATGLAEKALDSQEVQ